MLYSLGYQDFRTLREDGRTYVDKTAEIARVLELNKYLFLARPRRFGKSLTVSTLAELHSGDRALFGGLWAHGHWDFEARHSNVVWLQFASSHFMSEGLEAGLHNMLDRNAERLGVDLPARSAASPSKRFAELLRSAATSSPSGKTVLLIDEYDKPIVQYIGEREGEEGELLLTKARAHRDQLKAFYAVLKDADPHLQLVFITGVSAFAQVSIFSDLNNVTNLSLHRAAGTLVGITQEEVDATYGVPLAATGVDRAEVRRWYNGYRFAQGAERVYNPWSLQSFLQQGLLEGFWYATGTPTWLLKRIANVEEFNPSCSKVGLQTLLGFDLDRVAPLSLLFQTGYLTIADTPVRHNVYTLDFPNLEVREAFDLGLLDVLTGSPDGNARVRTLGLEEALEAGDLTRVIALIDATLADVPHQLWASQREAAYHMIVHVMFRTVGVYLQSEVSSARGRADAIVETAGRIYGFEFKVGASAEEALAQIRERGYLAKYADDPRPRVAVGVSFDPERRCVGAWRGEEV